MSNSIPSAQILATAYERVCAASPSFALRKLHKYTWSYIWFNLFLSLFLSLIVLESERAACKLLWGIRMSKVALSPAWLRFLFFLYFFCPKIKPCSDVFLWVQSPLEIRVIFYLLLFVVDGICFFFVSFWLHLRFLGIKSFFFVLSETFFVSIIQMMMKRRSDHVDHWSNSIIQIRKKKLPSHI